MKMKNLKKLKVYHYLELDFMTSLVIQVHPQEAAVPHFNL